MFRAKKMRKSRKMKKGNKMRRSRKYLKGGNGETVTCSMCEKTVDKDNTLVPLDCLNKHGRAAHRICKSCWWNPTTGFAREGTRHKCPGCLKDLPLTTVKNEPPILIDLTEE